MFMQEVREDIVKYGKRMCQEGLTVHTGGYLGYYNRADKAIAISPSATPYMDCTPGDVVIVDIEGNKLEDCNGKRRSSEWPVLQTIFKNREDINAVVHCHSRWANVMAALRMEVPVAYFEMANIGGSLRCTDYYIFTDPKLGEDVLDKMKGRTAVLMGNHGLVACGSTIKEAYESVETIEFSCEIFWRAKCLGNPIHLTDVQIEEMITAARKYREGGRIKEQWKK